MSKRVRGDREKRRVYGANYNHCNTGVQVVYNTGYKVGLKRQVGVLHEGSVLRNTRKTVFYYNSTLLLSVSQYATTRDIQRQKEKVGRTVN